MIMITMAGLPASGKSVLAREISRALPAVILDKDEIRASLFPPEEIEYSLRQDDFCFDILLQVAGFLLEKGRDVILDGRPFAHRYQMDKVVNFANQVHVPLKVIECTCSDASFRRRLEQDVSLGTHLAANRSFSMFLEMRAKADPLVVPRQVIDTDRPLAECVARAIDYLQTPPLSSSAQRVQNALQTMGFTNLVVEHEQTTRSAKEAAQAIGCDIGQIVKSLIFRTRESKQPILVLASGPNRVNETHLGELVNEPVERANPDFVHEVTGFAIGGVPPLGFPAPIITFIDADLMKFDAVWAAAGTPNAVFNLTPQEMEQITHGQITNIQ
jgi:prolyl-tRNA editing enzyme YbaK/EbsC (Cys-tRNA(Pro) deacylase)/predicted kinase